MSPLTTLRSALLPLAGAVSLHKRNQLAVTAAFLGSGLYLSGRIAGTDPRTPVDAAELSPFELLLAVVALLVVAGTVALPVVRAVLRHDWRRWIWALIALVMVAVSGIGAGLAASLIGPLTWSHLLVAPGVEPPWWATFLPLALGTGAAIGGPRWLGALLSRFVAPAWRSTKSIVCVVVATALIAVWAWDPMYEALTDGVWWQQLAVWSWLASVPLTLGAIVFLPPLLRERPKRRRQSGARRSRTPQVSVPR